MNRQFKPTIVISMTIAAVIGSISLINPGHTQSAGSFVNLQGTTPGTPQIGNTSISGMARVGAFRLGSSATPGWVLTADANGVGTWLPASGGTSYLAGSGLLLSGNVFSIAPSGVTNSMVNDVAWGKITGAPTSFPPNGAAGGDLIGTYPNPTLALLPSSLFKVSGGVMTALANGNIGIGIASPEAKLHVLGLIKSNGFQMMASPTPGYVLTTDANGVGTWQAPQGGFSLPFGGQANIADGAPFSITNTNTQTVSYGIVGRSKSPIGIGVFGHAGPGGDDFEFSRFSNLIAGIGGIGLGPVAGYGGYFDVTSASGVGVAGFALDTTGANVGGQFYSYGPGGTGAYAEAVDTTSPNIGVHGKAIGTTGGQGVLGEGLTGVQGNGFTGVFGTSATATGIGVEGRNFATTGNSYGVLGRSHSDFGTGIFGQGGSAGAGVVGNGGWGVQGIGQVYGIYGLVNGVNATGVLGYNSATTGLAYGIHGVTSSPAGFAVYSQGALKVDGMGIMTGFKLTTTPAAGYVLTSDATGVGTWQPATGGGLTLPYSGHTSAGAAGQAVFSVLNDATTGSNFGIFGEAKSTQGIGVYGICAVATGINFGGFFENSSAEGAGLLGRSNALSGGTGVHGVASAPNGEAIGVFGENYAPEGSGVVGRSYTSGTNWGGIFENESDVGGGVAGYANSTTGPNAGVLGQSASSEGVGVAGYATIGTGVFGSGILGGDFVGFGTTGKAVRGLAPGTSGATFGGHFATYSPGGVGVFGLNGSPTGIAAYGVFGQTDSASAGAAAVYGLASPDGGVTYGGKFLTNSTTTNACGVYATGPTGVLGIGTNYGGRFSTGLTDGRGVYGYAYHTSGLNYGGYFESSSSIGRGVYATSPDVGILGNSSGSSGIGVYGVASAANAIGGKFQGLGTSSYGMKAEGLLYGGYGIATSADSYGLYGKSSGTGGFGVYGEGPYGVYGKTTTTSGYGVFGKTTSSTAYAVYGDSAGYGVFGKTTSTTKAGVHGEGNGYAGVYGTSATGNGVFGYAGQVGVAGTSFATSGTTYGGNFLTYSTDGSGVAGFAETGSGPSRAVYGWCDSTTGYGLLAKNVSTSGINYGVYGQVSSSSGWAGYFLGGQGIFADDASAGVKAFLIDHPLDPENYYLAHSSVESPDMKNIYDGNVTTNQKGEAWVELPDYFEALNRDFRYQLTVIGKFAQAIIGTEIVDRKFSILTDKPNVKVSWQVTGIRQDPVANARRVKVVRPKLPEHRGKYLAPEAYGLPREDGIGYASHVQTRIPTFRKPNNLADSHGTTTGRVAMRNR